MNAQQEMQPNTKDNILLITTDQQRFDTINALETRVSSHRI